MSTPFPPPLVISGAPESGALPRARVRIRDVARAAGVSTSTVSNVLNHPERVAEAKRVRVEESMRQLGFVRNESARHLRAGRSDTLGLLLLDAWNPFFTAMAQGVEDWTFERGWRLLVANSSRSPERESVYLTVFAERRVEGLIAAPRPELLPQLVALQERGLPCVVVDLQSTIPDLMSVALDDVRGGYLAMNHLLELGHRRIAFAGDVGSVSHVRERYYGAMRAVAACRSAVQLSILEPRHLTVDAGRDLGAAIAKMPAKERPRAVFAASDLVAIGIMEILINGGIAVPHEVAIVGYDDNEFARQVLVPLTTVRQPAYEMGRTAADLMLRRLSGAPVPEPHVLFQPELVIRESTVERKVG